MGMRPTSMFLAAIVAATVAMPVIGHSAQRVTQGRAILPDDPNPTTLSLATVATPSDIEGEVSDMYVRGDSLEVVYANTGKRATDIIGAVQVRTLGDTPVTEVPLHAATVSPGTRYVMRVAMPKLAKGKYSLYAIVDYGGGELTAARAALEIK